MLINHWLAITMDFSRSYRTHAGNKTIFYLFHFKIIASFLTWHIDYFGLLWAMSFVSPLIKAYILCQLVDVFVGLFSHMALKFGTLEYQRLQKESILIFCKRLLIVHQNSCNTCIVIYKYILYHKRYYFLNSIKKHIALDWLKTQQSHVIKALLFRGKLWSNNNMEVTVSQHGV